MANPFSRAYQDQADYYRTDPPSRASAGGLSVFPTSRQAPMPPVSSSGMGPAPEAPMRRPSQFTPGSLFWLLSGGANAPSQEEYLLDRQQRQKDAVGQKRALAYKKMSEILPNVGGNPQKAFLKFVNTPEGMDFVMTDPDPEGAMSDFLKIAVPPQEDPELAIKKGEFGLKLRDQDFKEREAELKRADQLSKDKKVGEIMGGNPQTPNGGQPYVDLGLGGDEPQPQGSGVKIKRPDTGEEVELEQGEETGDVWRKKAIALATIDPKAADSALEIAKQLDAKNTEPGSQAWIRGEQIKARNAVHIETGKEVFKQSEAGRRLKPALAEISRLNENVPGGYKGAIAPYLGRVASLFGWEIKSEWSDAEALNAMNQQLIPLVKQTGPVSNYEQVTYQQALPGLIATREGRFKIIKALEAQIQRTADIAALYEKYMGTDQLTAKLAELDAKPMFDPETASVLKRAAAGEKVYSSDDDEAKAPPPKKAAEPPLITNADEWNTIKDQPGTYFRRMNPKTGKVETSRVPEAAKPTGPAPKTRTGRTY